MSDAEEPESEEIYEGPICPVCLAPIEEDFDYCPRCETPLSQYATADPLKTIRTEGEMFRRGANAPSLIVVIGMWIIFSPVLMVSAYPVIEQLRANGKIEPGTFFILLFAAFYGAILYKVTSRYVIARRRRATTPPEE